jgi:hypothetical protein
LRRAGSDLSREGFVDALEALDGWDENIMRRPISYGPGVRGGIPVRAFFSSPDLAEKRLVRETEDFVFEIPRDWPSDIMSGAVTSDSQNIGRFMSALARSTGETADAAVADAPPADAAPVAQPATGATLDSEVRTFPMEDPSPGGEPPQ